mmetsp:Transcript_2236/g.2777  ORF Transcript_2236/g.2777 Transcript_2236/m.2777 type:complete len:134 (+) Transcript_2236:122-523(+)
MGNVCFVLLALCLALFACDGRKFEEKKRFLSEKGHHTESTESNEASSLSRSHSEGIVKTWLSKARLDKELAASILDTGGFVCWSVLIQLHLQHLGTNLVRKEERDKLLDMCYHQHSPDHHHHHHHHHHHYGQQ